MRAAASGSLACGRASSSSASVRPTSPPSQAASAAANSSAPRRLVAPARAAPAALERRRGDGVRAPCRGPARRPARARRRPRDRRGRRSRPRGARRGGRRRGRAAPPRAPRAPRGARGTDARGVDGRAHERVAELDARRRRGGRGRPPRRARGRRRSRPSCAAARPSGAELARVARGREHQHAPRRLAGSARSAARTRPRCSPRSAPAHRRAPAASRAASAPSSSSASGLPPVARYRRSAVSRATPLASSSAASARSSPATRSVRRSAPSSSDGSPSRTASTSAIGSATSRRTAKQQRLGARAVEQVRVVDEQRERRLLGVGGEQAQRRGADREAVARGRRAERERAPERGRLRPGDPVERAERRAQQLGEPRERDLGLRLDAARAQHAHPPGLPGRVLEQRGLADPGLADEREHAALAVPRLGQEPVERQPLLVAAEQHLPILTVRRSRCERPGPPSELGAPRMRPRIGQAYGRRTPDQRRSAWQRSRNRPPRSTARSSMQFVFRAVDEVGATLNAALVVMGDKLGLYRALAGAGGLTPRRARAPRRRQRALRPRVAERAGGRRLRRVRPGSGQLHAAARAGRRADRRGEPCLPARLLPDRARHRHRLAAHHRGRPQRRRRRLARAQPRRVRGLRALLPARLQRQPDPVLAAGARRRRREARARRARSPTSAAATAPRRS